MKHSKLVPQLPFCRLVGNVSNCAYAVRLETAPTGGESVYLCLDFTIIIAICNFFGEL